MFLSIAEQTKLPLTLIEVGTSAGLLLCLDAYNYEYKDANKSIKIENSQDSLLLHRIGIDLNIVDLNNQEELEWMLALIWPEHSERRQQFLEASQISSGIDKDMYEGDLLEILPSIIQSISPESQIVIFHTHVANQFPEQLKCNFESLLKDLSSNRPIYHIYNNMHDANLHQDYLVDGKVQEEKIYHSPDGHGRWFYWSTN